MKRIDNLDLYRSWEQVDPDGTECFVCGESCLLTMWQMIATSKAIETRVEMPFFACGSCYENLIDGVDR